HEEPVRGRHTPRVSVKSRRADSTRASWAYWEAKSACQLRVIERFTAPSCTSAFDTWATTAGPWFSRKNGCWSSGARGRRKRPLRSKGRTRLAFLSDASFLATSAPLLDGSLRLDGRNKLMALLRS